MSDFFNDLLEQWVEQCPAVELWLSHHLSLPGADHETLEQFWEEWSSACDPALPTALLTAGRDEAQAKLLSWLDDQSGVLTVAGDTEEEAAAFVYAALAGAPDAAGQRHLDRAIMLTPSGSVARLLEAETPMVLVAVDHDLLKKPCWQSRGARPPRRRCDGTPGRYAKRCARPATRPPHSLARSAAERTLG